MKKIMSILLTITMILTLSGCYSDQVRDEYESNQVQAIKDFFSTSYEGTYSSGNSVMRFSLISVDEEGNISLRVDFHNSENNVDTYAGAYIISGDVDLSTLEVEMTGESWINQPGGTWYMLGLYATLDLDNNEIVGHLDDYHDYPYQGLPIDESNSVINPSGNHDTDAVIDFFDKLYIFEFYSYEYNEDIKLYFNLAGLSENGGFTLEVSVVTESGVFKGRYFLSGLIDFYDLSFDLTQTSSLSIDDNLDIMYTLSGTLYTEGNVFSGTLVGDYSYAMNVYGIE